MGRGTKMIYLVNPSEKRILDGAGDRLPIGLLSLASELQKKHEVKVFDLNHKDIVEFWQEFHEDKPETVGISVYTSPIFKDAIDLAHAMRGKNTHKPRLIAGGHHATHMPETLIDHFDAVIKGEAENSFEVGLKFDGIIETNMPDLNKTANIDYSLLDMKNYGVNQNGKRTGTLITSRGCFGDCAFCGKLEKKVRFEPLSKVYEQMTNLKKYGFESLYFLDDIFTANKERMQIITDHAKYLGMPFRVTTRADLIDEDKMEILSKNGCELLSLGIESGDNGVLKRSSKRMTWQQNQKAVQMANKYDIPTKGFFIIGLPGENEFTAKKTISFAKNLRKMGMKYADFYYMTPFPGTPIWKNPEKYGIEITDRDYTKYLEAGKGAKCYVNTFAGHDHLGKPEDIGLKANRIEQIVREARSEWKN